MSCLRTAAVVSLLVATCACGGSSSNAPLQQILSPTAPSAPVQTDWSVSGRITSLTGAPVGRAVVTPSDSTPVQSDASGNYTIAANGQPSQNPYPLQVTANGYLRRRVWVEWQHGARTGVDINVISVAAPFSLTFYQQLARDAVDEPGSLQPLSLWPGGNPRVYVRTVDQNGDAISPDRALRCLQRDPRGRLGLDERQADGGHHGARDGDEAAAGRLDHRELHQEPDGR